MSPSAATLAVVAVDDGWTDLVTAEHAVLSAIGTEGADQDQVTVCTHILRLPTENRYAITVAAQAAVATRVAAAFARQATASDEGPLGLLAAGHAERTGGRAIRFPGQNLLQGRMEFGDVLVRSAIEVLHHTGNPPGPAAVLDTRNFVCPVFTDGALILLTQPGLDGDVMPFEVENPTRCCEFHA